MIGIWAVVPVKATDRAKQRLAPVLDAALRRDLALAMFEDVLDTLARVAALDGIVVATADRQAAALARRYGAVVSREDADESHSAAVAAVAARLARDGAVMLTVPADIPLIEPRDVQEVIRAVSTQPGFAIVPARDDRGSNAVLAALADAVPLRFGEESFHPHLGAARARGIAPVVLRLPRIALDIDEPRDLAAFLAMPSDTRARAFLDRHAISSAVIAEAFS